MNKLILIVFFVIGCGPSARQINADVAFLHRLAVQAAARHTALCTPPAPGAPAAARPAACGPVRACLDQVDTASQTCTAVLRGLAKTGEGNAAACRMQHTEATVACNQAGIQGVP